MTIRTVFLLVLFLCIGVSISIHSYAQSTDGRADIVVIEGDSLSNGGIGSPTDPRRSGDWVSYINQYLTWYSSASVFNIAAAGEQVEQMLPEYPTEARPHKPATGKKAYYIVYGGINDIQGSGVGGPARTPEETYADMKTLWATARADGFTVVAFTIHPFYPFSNPPQAEADAVDVKRKALNALILSDTSRYDILVRLDQVFPGGMPSATDPDFADRLHTNEQGAKKIALAIATAIKASTTTPPTTTTGGTTTGTTGATTATGGSTGTTGTVTTGTVTTGTIGGTTGSFATVGAPPLTCNERYTSAVVPPAGYGAAFNVFNTTHELLLRFDCDSVGNATFSVNSEDTSDQKYVYKNGFRWNGGSWVPITFQGTPAPSGGDWLLMGSQVRINNTDLRPANVFTFFAAYSCTFAGGAWHCGCRDSTCIFNGWQLQAIRNPVGGELFFGGGGTSGGTSGGTTGGGATTGGITGSGTTGGPVDGGPGLGLCYTTPTNNHTATPGTLQRELDSATAGVHIVLSPGNYSDRYTFNKNGTEANVILIEGGPGVSITGPFSFNGSYAVLKGMNFTARGSIEMSGAQHNRVTRNTFQNTAGQNLIDMSGSNYSNDRIDHNSFMHFTNAAVEMSLGGPKAEQHQGMRFDHNYFLDHRVTGSNESVMRMLTDAFHDSKLMYDYNLFDNVLQNGGEPEVVSMKTGGVILRGNTLVNSGRVAFTFRETNNSIAELNYLADGAYFKVYGDNHIVRGNTVVGGGIIGIGAGNGTMDQRGSPSCDKYGLTALLSTCNTAHAASRNVQVYENQGTIRVGTYETAYPAFNTTLHNNSGPITLEVESQTHNNGGPLTGTQGTRLSPGQVGVDGLDPSCTGN